MMLLRNILRTQTNNMSECTSCECLGAPWSLSPGQCGLDCILKELKATRLLLISTDLKEDFSLSLIWYT